MAGLESVEKGQPLNKQKAESNKQPNSSVDVSRKGNITINVFFDGTGNNMYNTKARLDKSHTKLAKETSYLNYYSNIALLFMASTETGTVKNIYIEGAGTFKYGADGTFGLAFAAFASGVYARVKEAFAEAEKIRKKLQSIEITFNVFGFSRGAFYARYFCAMAKTPPKLAMDEYGIFTESGRDSLNSGRHQLNMEPKGVKINFVGLYDTVSSHGIKHYNDVKPFKLNIGKKQEIRKIVHLTAQNDYRNHFPLTHINTAAADGSGFECSLPGAHSDIGGAYCHDWHETQYMSLLNERSGMPKKEGEIPWGWFVNMGYYRGEPVFKPRRPDGKTNYTEQLILEAKTVGKSLEYRNVYANRKFTSNSYQFIQLEIMKKLAETEMPSTFNNKGKAILDKDISSIEKHPILIKFRNYAKGYVLRNYKSSGLNYVVRADSVLSAEEQKQLYNKYIHNSLEPDTVPNGSDSRNRGPKRIDIKDHA